MPTYADKHQVVSDILEGISYIYIDMREAGIFPELVQQKWGKETDPDILADKK